MKQAELMTAKDLGINPTGRYTRKQTADLLGISLGTLNRRVNAGTIMPRYYKCNNRPFFPGSEIVRVLNEVI